MEIEFFRGRQGDVIARPPNGKIGLPRRDGPQPQDGDIWEVEPWRETASGKAVILTLRQRIATLAEREAARRCQALERVRRTEEERLRAEEERSAAPAVAFMPIAAQECGDDAWGQLVRAWYESRAELEQAQAVERAAEAACAAIRAETGDAPMHRLPPDLAVRLSQACHEGFAAAQRLSAAQERFARDGAWEPFAAPAVMRRLPETRRILADCFRREPRTRPTDRFWVRRAVEVWMDAIAR